MSWSRSAGPLLVAADFDGRGGMERKIRRLAGSLARDGPVTVLTWNHHGGPKVVDPGPRITVVRVPTLASWKEYPRGARAHLGVGWSLAVAVAEAIRLRPRGTIYAGGLFPEGIVAALAGRALGAPFVLDTWLPGPLGNVALLERGRSAPLLKWLLRGGRAYVAETQEVAEELIAMGISPSRIHIVPNGIPLEDFPLVDDSARSDARRRLGIAASGVVAYCGRFDLRQKRLDLLLSAWQRTRPDGWQLLLVGDGPDRPAIVERARELSPAPLLPGWHDDVRPFLAAADAFVLPTEFEGHPAGMLEGMACGLPGIVSAIPVFQRLRPPGVSLVPNELDAWERALDSLVAARGELTTRGLEARAWVERYHDWLRTVAAYRSLLAL